MNVGVGVKNIKAMKNTFVFFIYLFFPIYLLEMYHGNWECLIFGKMLW